MSEIVNLKLEGDGAPDIDLDDQFIRVAGKGARPWFFGQHRSAIRV